MPDLVCYRVAVLVVLGAVLFGCRPADASHTDEHAAVAALIRKYDVDYGVGYDTLRGHAERIEAQGSAWQDERVRASGLVRLAFLELEFNKWGNEWRAKLEQAARAVEGSGGLAEIDLLTYRGFMRAKWLERSDDGMADLQRAARMATQLRADGRLCVTYALSSAAHRFRGETVLAHDTACRALQIAEALGGRGYLVQALFAAMHSWNLTAPTSEQRERCLRRLVEFGYPESVLAERFADDHAEATVRAALAALDPDSEQPDEVRRLANLRFVLARSLCSANDRLQEARDLASQAIEYFRDIGNGLHEAAATLVRLDANSRLGAPKSVLEDDLDRVREPVRGAGQSRAMQVLSRVLLRMGRSDESDRWSELADEARGRRDEQIADQVERSAQEFWQAELRARASEASRADLQRRAAHTQQLMTVAVALLLVGALGWRHYSTRKLLARLQHEIVEREQEQARNAALQEKLFERQKLEAIGTLATGVAHELNNSLTAVMGFASLERDATGESENLKAILDAAHMATHTARDLLVYARPGDAAYTALNLTSLVGEMFAFVDRLLPASIDRSAIVPDEADVWCIGDDAKLRQALLNLILNARDAVRGNGILNVALAIDPEQPEYARIQVRDNGVGMDPRVRDRVFEPFFTTKDGGKGTGLGMWIVRSVVADHGGSIDIASQPGRGTTVSVRLPVCEAAPREPAVHVQGGGRERLVLVAEDDAAIRTLVRQVLVGAGYRVAECRHFDQVLPTFERYQQQVKALLFDVDLPGGSGIAAGESIRGRSPAMPLVVMSGLPLDGCPDGAGKLSKPFTPQQLLAQLAAVIDAGPAA